MAGPAPSASSPTVVAPTLLTQLQSLTQPSLALPPAYLHPFAPLNGNAGPAGWKGKGKQTTADSIQSQLDVIRDMRMCVEQAKSRLIQRDGDWGKLSRALKEVVSHQSTLLSLSTTLNPAYLRPSTTPSLPSSRTAMSPVQLLPALAQSQDIQTYLEDSQFGLLKSTLTLAGNCFVIDIDLETDGAADEDESAVPTPAAGSTIPESAGLVRLSKIAVSYVTQGGGMEASDYIAGVLKAAVEAYLSEWNSVVEGLAKKGERGKRLEWSIRRIEGLLAEVKSLDGSVQVEGVPGEEAGFVAMEGIAKRVSGLMTGENCVYAAAHPTICPSFALYPPDQQSPLIRIRPAQPGENVPVPLIPAGNASSSKWLLEVIPEPASNGIAVRRNWLGGSEGSSNPWDGGIKIENLLYKPNSGPSLHVNPFPYQSTFVHKPKAAGSLEQHWSLASPGPDGYVIGRMGLPDSDDDLRRVFQCIKRQIQMNQAFAGIFNPESIASQEAGSDDDEDMEDLLADPTAIPITLTQTQDHMSLESPFPHSDGSISLRLELGPGVTRCDFGDGLSDERKQLANSAIERLSGVDIVEDFRIVESALRRHA